MKKLIALALTVIVVLSLAGCGGNGGQNGNTTETTSSEVNTVADLKDPEMKWWTIYNPNGFNTFAMKIKNNNSVDIDCGFNVTFMKDGKEIGTYEDFYVNCLQAGEEFTAWANTGIPDSADDIKVEYTYIYESNYTPIEVSIVKSEKTPEGVYVELKPDSMDFSTGSVYVVFYDANGEPTEVQWKTFISTEELAGLIEGINTGVDFEIFTNFYK